ncbi:FAD-dependent oxidoreductase [Georgenia sp. AZ-5]|uniref:FAD-dependent oxidoreductase n=1 Tax=Georgenia sp. AZ-5 TaxID=3367526 RepID=UPI0037548D05
MGRDEHIATQTGERTHDVDVVVVGAGFAGLHMLWKLRGLGYSVQVLERAPEARRSTRSSRTRRPPTASSRAVTRSGPSARSSPPTSTRPSTGTTSRSSTCERRRSTPSRRKAYTWPMERRTSSMP